jgi:hypothetical protein
LNWEELKTKAEVVNKVVMTFAIAAGAIWTMYTFNGELKVANAKAELDKRHRELNLESIEAVVTSKVLPQLENGADVQVQVSLYNKGNKDVPLDIHENPLRITPMQTPTPYKPHPLTETHFFPPPLMTDIKGKLVRVKSLSIPAGGQSSLLYIQHFDHPGRFLVEFTPNTKKNEQLDSVELTASEIITVLQQDVDGKTELK